MKKYKFVVEVPATEPNAYNPDRLISDLVRNQILHMSLAERHLEPRHRTGIDIYSIKTERQASEYLEHLTKKLHGRRNSGRRPSAKSATARKRRKK
jgi:hypothetical protein